MGMNEFDHHILALLEQQRERPEKFRSADLDLCGAGAVLHQFMELPGQLRAGRYVGRLYVRRCGDTADENTGPNE